MSISSVIKKLCNFIPAEIILNCFFVGKITFARDFCIACFSALVCGLVLLLDKELNMFGLQQPNSNYFTAGGPLFALSIMLAVGGYILAVIYMNRKNNNPEEIAIEAVAGQIFAVSLTLPVIYYAGIWWNGIVAGMCKSFFMCSTSTVHFVSTLLSIPIPFVVYYFIYQWKPWPITFFEQHFSTAPSVILGGMTAGIYVVLICYIVLLIPFQMDLTMLGGYFKYVFALGTRYLGINDLLKIIATYRS